MDQRQKLVVQLPTPVVRASVNIQKRALVDLYLDLFGRQSNVPPLVFHVLHHDVGAREVFIEQNNGEVSGTRGSRRGIET